MLRERIGPIIRVVDVTTSTTAAAAAATSSQWCATERPTRVAGAPLGGFDVGAVKSGWLVLDAF